jgi:hypothetical protein
MTEKKNRHGCLTAYLSVMLLANSVTALTYTLGGAAISEALPDMPGWGSPVLAVLGLFNLVCTVGLFKWKKWSFYGFCASCALTLAVNLSLGVGVVSIVGGLMGVILLYGVLQIGGDKSGWAQLD